MSDTDDDTKVKEAEKVEDTEPTDNKAVDSEADDNADDDTKA